MPLRISYHASLVTVAVLDQWQVNKYSWQLSNIAEIWQIMATFLMLCCASAPYIQYFNFHTSTPFPNIVFHHGSRKRSAWLYVTGLLWPTIGVNVCHRIILELTYLCRHLSTYHQVPSIKTPAQYDCESPSSHPLLPLLANLNKVCQSSNEFFQLRPVQLSILFLIQSLPTAAILLRPIPLAVTTVRHNVSEGRMDIWVQGVWMRGAEVKLSTRTVAKICRISAISDRCQL